MSTPAIPNPMVATIRERLEAAFAPTALEILDEGHRHIGHTGEGKGHFHVHIVSAAFVGMTTVQCHRVIYAAVADLMEHGIHALAIDAQPAP
jgi:BolA protein